MTVVFQMTACFEDTTQELPIDEFITESGAVPINIEVLKSHAHVNPNTGFLRSNRWHLSFSDDFNGPINTQEATECFDIPLQCTTNQAWPTPCTADEAAHLSLLNRCNWHVKTYPELTNRSDDNIIGVNTTEMVQVKDGRLVLSAGKLMDPPYDCGRQIGEQRWDERTRHCPWQYGTIESQPHINKWGGPNIPGFHQTYGRFEVRGRISKGDGAWGAFWLLPSQHGLISGAPTPTWPDSGEFDLMENYGDGNPIRVTYHGLDCEGENFFGRSRPHVVYGSLVNPQNPYSNISHDDFHTFAYEWTENELKATVDNIVVWVMRHHSEIEQGAEYAWNRCKAKLPHQFPYYFILNELIVPEMSSSQVTTENYYYRASEVDYVRAYDQCKHILDECPTGGEPNGSGLCISTSEHPIPNQESYLSTCVENTLTADCPNPCEGIGLFDGFSCLLQQVPQNITVTQDVEGNVWYKPKQGNTTESFCKIHGDTLDSQKKACLAGTISHRQVSQFNGVLFTPAMCSTTNNLPLCENPCPYGGNYDGANCHVGALPDDATGAIADNKYGRVQWNIQPNEECHSLGNFIPEKKTEIVRSERGQSVEVTRCVFSFAKEAQVFLYQNSVYTKPCGGGLDIQSIGINKVFKVNHKRYCGEYDSHALCDNPIDPPQLASCCFQNELWTCPLESISSVTELDSCPHSNTECYREEQTRPCPLIDDENPISLNCCYNYTSYLCEVTESQNECPVTLDESRCLQQPGPCQL